MRRAARRDANHQEVIAAFEKMGCTVIDVAGIPCGFDILVGYGGLCLPVEIKDGTKPPSARKLTDNEAKVHAAWTGGARLVKDLDGVQETVRTLRRWHATLVAASPARRGWR